MNWLLNWKNYFIIAALAFGLGVPLGAYMGRAALEGEHNEKLLDIERENGKAIARAQGLKDDVEKENRQLKEDLANLKTDLEGKNSAKVKTLETRIAELSARPAGVLWDPGYKPSAACKAAPAGENRTTTVAEPADSGGRLSDAAHDFLLKTYARNAEVTRLDLITQREYNVQLTIKYNEMVDRVNKANGYTE